MSTETTSTQVHSAAELERMFGQAFYKIPRVLQLLRAALDLNLTDLNVLSVYWTCVEARETPRQPSYNEISANLGISKRTIADSLRRLVKIGLLIRPRGGKTGARNAYRIDLQRVYSVVSAYVLTVEEDEEAKQQKISEARRMAGKNGAIARWEKERAVDDEREERRATAVAHQPTGSAAAASSLSSGEITLCITDGVWTAGGSQIEDPFTFAICGPDGAPFRASDNLRDVERAIHSGGATAMKLIPSLSSESGITLRPPAHPLDQELKAS